MMGHLTSEGAPRPGVRPRATEKMTSVASCDNVTLLPTAAEEGGLRYRNYSVAYHGVLHGAGRTKY